MTQACTTTNASDSALAALRAMVAIADSTLAKATEALTLTQFRALRLVTELTPVTMSRVAQELDINPSSITRACARLETAGVLQRAQNPLNKRETLLAPTVRGRQIVTKVDQDRRAVLRAVFDHVEPAHRAAVAAALERFAQAAGTALHEPRTQIQ